MCAGEPFSAQISRGYAVVYPRACRGTVAGRGDSGNYIRTQVPLGLLRELSEVPFIDAIMVDDPSVPGLTLAESSKIIHTQLAEIMAAHVAGVVLPDDPNFVNNRMTKVTDGTVRIAIRITG